MTEGLRLPVAAAAAAAAQLDLNAAAAAPLPAACLLSQEPLAGHTRVCAAGTPAGQLPGRMPRTRRAVTLRGRARGLLLLLSHGFAPGHVAAWLQCTVVWVR